MAADPLWLTWAREIQAIAQTGLAFVPNVYDRERYERLRRLAAEIVANHTGANVTQVIELFGMQQGPIHRMFAHRREANLPADFD